MCRSNALSQTGSTLARTKLSPFARCRLGLNRHFIKNILSDHCLHDSGLYIQKILTKREMSLYQKFNFLLFLTINYVTTGVRELNGTNQMSLVTHNAKGDLDEISSGLARMDPMSFTTSFKKCNVVMT